MRLLLPGLICTLVLAAVAGPALGRQTSDQRNAVALYLKAHARYLALELSDAESMEIDRFDATSARGPSEHIRQLVARFQSTIRMTQRASRLPYADFTDRRGPGPYWLMDDQSAEFAAIRRLTRPMFTDLMIRLHDGEYALATERIATVYRMGQHVAGEHTLMAALVSAALNARADGEIDLALQYSAIGPAEAEVLLRVTGDFDRDDPCHFVPAILHEQQNAIQRLATEYTGEDAVERLASELEQPEYVEEPSLTAVRALDPEQLAAEIERCDQVMQRVVAAFQEQDQEKSKAAMAAIASEIESERHGPLAKVMLGHLAKAHRSMLMSRDQLRQRRAMLKDLAEGKIDPMSLANAAVWYLRALAAIDRLDPVKLESARVYSRAHTQAADADLIKFLSAEEMTPIIDTLRQASRLKRCDFELARDWWPQAFYDYHLGMHDAARLMTADAARLIHAQDFAAAADRLAIVYRMSNHLGMDKQLMGPLLGHAAFNAADALCASAFEAKWFTDEQLLQLWDSIELVRTVDAFGYRRAESEARGSEMQGWLALHTRKDQPVNPEHLTKPRAFLLECDGDRLLWLTVIEETAWGPPASEAPSAFERGQRLSDVISLDGLREAVLQADAMKPLMEQGDYAAVLAVEAPVIARLNERSEDASDDVRRARARLEPKRNRR